MVEVPEDVDGFSHLIEHIQDAVVGFELVGSEPEVRWVNEAFVDLFGYSRDQIVNARLNKYIVPEWLRREAAALDKRTDDGEVNYQRVQRQTFDGLQEFLYRGIPYDSDRVDGFAVYTPLTKVSRQERQVQVLNRVLRHNLRNQVTVIEGNVDRLIERLDRSDDRTDEIATDARESISNLRNLSEEVGQIHQILGRPPTGDNRVDLMAVLDDTVEEFRKKYPSSVIKTDIPPTLFVRASSNIRTAVEELVENAVEHNPADQSHIWIYTQPVVEDEWIDLVIDDDGPTIPESERKVIADGAEITSHQHGSGLGLWLAKWTVEKSGGQLLIGESSLGGNKLRIRLQTFE
ncbi:ATP-binding protein [Natrinema sp. H-ect4]|uniref:sensor histidine kinase n=1 Tax=Natrinema sp. H-ect4 TaxID=3242699 RepID=UPI0035A89B6D